MPCLVNTALRRRAGQKVGILDKTHRFDKISWICLLFMFKKGRGVKFDSSQSAAGFTQKLNYSVDDRSDVDNLIASWVLGIHDQERFSHKIAGKQLH